MVFGIFKRVTDIVTGRSDAFESEIARLRTELQKCHAVASNLEEELQATKIEKKKLEDALRDSNERLHDTKNLAGELRNELGRTQRKFLTTEDKLKAAGLREAELKEKLKSAEVALRDSNNRLRDTKNLAGELRNELGKIQRKFLTTVDKLMAAGLREAELMERLKSAEDALRDSNKRLHDTENLAEDLRNELGKTQRKFWATEDKLKAAGLREVELMERLKYAESQIEQQASTINKLQSKLSQYETYNRSLAEVDLKLTYELVESKLKLNDLRGELSQAVSEKEYAIEEQCSSKKAIEDLTHQQSTERQRLESELSTIIVEKNQLHEAYVEAERERESVTTQLEEHMKDYTLKEEALSTEIRERASSEAKLEELEEQFYLAEAQLKKVESAQAEGASRVEILTSQIEEYKQKVNDIRTLNEKVLQLEKELQLAKKCKVKKCKLLLQSFDNRARNSCKELRNLPKQNRGTLLLKRT